MKSQFFVALKRAFVFSFFSFFLLFSLLFVARVPLFFLPPRLGSEIISWNRFFLKKKQEEKLFLILFSFVSSAQLEGALQK